MKFYLGTHETSWLGSTEVPLFVSHHRLRRRRRLPVAVGRWACDSGAFTEVANQGRFTTTAYVYAAAVARYAEEIGGLDWCAPQDWMCEPFVLARTGYTIADHQRMTLHSYLDLSELGVPVIPVLQGWTLADYLRHADIYENCGIALDALDVVGVGSVCRRQATSEVEAILCALAARGYRLHGFGLKTLGLRRCSHALTSADSMAWSYRARNAGPQEGCTHKSCANCLRFALAWREKVLGSLGNQQLSFGVAA